MIVTFFLTGMVLDTSLIDFMRNDTPSKIIFYKKLPTEIFLKELNLRKKK